MRASTLSILTLGIIIGVLSTSAIAASIKGSSMFTDVPKGSPADDAIGEMVSLGIMKGINNKKFSPNERVTRAELAIILKNLRDSMKGTTVGTSSVSSVSSQTSASSTISSVSSTSSSSTGPLPYNAGGYIQFGAKEYNIEKNDATGLVTIVIARIGGNQGGGTVDYAFNTGTAIADKDYQPLSGTLTFNSKETSKKIQLKIINNTSDVGHRSVTLMLKNPTGAVKIGNPSTATVHIKDPRVTTSAASSTSTTSNTTSTTEALVSWSALQYGAMENAPTFLITVERKGVTTGASEVNFASADITARSGTDYASNSGKVTFAAGETSKTISIALVNNATIEGNRSFSLTLSSPSAGTRIVNAVTTVVVTDDDAGFTSGSGSMKFSSSSYTVLENKGEAVITVNKVGGFGAASVVYQTTGGSALAGSDFTTTSGTLNFAANETSKTFIIPITIDTVSEESETINISLSSANRSSLGDPSTATVFIQG